MKRTSCMILCAILALLLVPFVWARADGAPWSGSGTGDDLWRITTAQELASIHDYMVSGQETQGKFFRLENDVNLTGYYSLLHMSWTPIGGFGEQSLTFDGNFDGGWKTISGFMVVTSDAGSPTSAAATTKGTFQAICPA